MTQKSPFLKKIAQELISEFDYSELKDVTIVLPNKRAGIFLKKYIAQLIDKPVLLPRITGMEEFVLQTTGLHKADNIYLLSELFTVYQTFFPEETFDSFLSVGQVLLSDFNEIDRYLINPDDIYKNIVDYKAFDVWEFDKENLTDIQHNYLEFWRKIPEIYTRFQEQILQEHFAYQGLLYRYLCNNFSLLEQFPASSIWFCGFNALTRSEEEIINFLRQNNQARIFWDIDEFYLKDAEQEAGVFIRKHLKNIALHTREDIKWISRNLQTENKVLNEIECNGNILQAKALHDFCVNENISPDEETVIVLADESLLLPVLSSLPEQVAQVNVTMGLPLKDTPLTSFMLKYIRLFYHVTAGLEKHNFYYKDFFEVLNEPFFSILLDKKFGLTVKEIQEIFRENNLIYFTLQDLHQAFSEKKTDEMLDFYRLFQFSETVSVTQIIDKLKHILYLKRTVLDTQKTIDSIELEVIFEWNKLLVQLQDIIRKNQCIRTVKSLLFVLKQLLPQHRIDFYGEPLAGIQVMGMLETRNLDFSQVLMLSVNEGILPFGKTAQTFIPFEVKKHFGLPTHYEKDAIYAYHFYRLLQYPEKITLFYNNEKDELGAGGEKSRFIHQIINDLPNFSVTKKIYHAANTTSETLVKRIKNTAEIREKIIEYLTHPKGVSPSALNTFMNCPLDFYNKYILGIKENENIEENIEANVMGDIIHSTLEKLYTPYINNILTESIISKCLQEYSGVLQQEFTGKFKNKNYYRYGQNKIIYELTNTMIYNFLQFEKQAAKKNQTVILGLEKKIKEEIQINYQGQPLTIFLTGKIDRIEQYNDHLRIIDYKTGRAQDSLSKAYRFQLQYYAYLYFLQNQKLPNSSGLYYLSQKSPKLVSLLPKNEVLNQEYIQLIEEEIQTVILSILETEYFEHNSKSNYCVICTA